MQTCALRGFGIVIPTIVTFRSIKQELCRYVSTKVVSKIDQFNLRHENLVIEKVISSCIRTVFPKQKTVFQYSISINGILPNQQPVKTGVPQSFILDIILLYIFHIENIVHAHCSCILLYTDDVQLYLYLSLYNIDEPIILLESCTSDLIVLFSENKLVCYPLKSNVVYFSPRFPG